MSRYAITRPAFANELILLFLTAKLVVIMLDFRRVHRHMCRAAAITDDSFDCYAGRAARILHINCSILQ